MYHSTEGGFDVLAVSLNRKRGIPVARVVRICDCTVILLQSLGQPLKNTAAGILVILISTAVISHFVAASPRRYLLRSLGRNPKAA